jgi:hypothetical protein
MEDIAVPIWEEGGRLEEALESYDKKNSLALAIGR